jgi:hypothetical protein
MEIHQMEIHEPTRCLSMNPEELDGFLNQVLVAAMAKLVRPSALECSTHPRAHWPEVLIEPLIEPEVPVDPPVAKQPDRHEALLREDLGG